MTRSSKTCIAALGALLALGLSACGSSGDDIASKPAADIVKTVTAQMKALTSVTLSGTIANAGQQMTLDLSADTHGDCSGSLGIAGGTAQVVAVAGVSYLKGDAAFWHGAAGSSGDQVIALLGSKWAKMPSSSGFSDVCNLTKLFSQLNNVTGTLSKKGTSTINGTKALEIDSAKSDGTTHIFVALDGNPYILRVTKSGGSPGTVTLSKFDVPVGAKAPAASDVVDLSSLGG